MAVSKQYIKDQLAKVGKFRAFCVGKELRALHEIIADGENIKFLTSGFVRSGDNAAVHGASSKGKGKLKTVLLVATDRRVFLLDSNFLYGRNLVNYPYDKISSCGGDRGFIFGSVMLSTGGVSGNDSVINWVKNADVTRMVSTINDLMYKYKNLFGKNTQ